MIDYQPRQGSREGKKEEGRREGREGRRRDLMTSRQGAALACKGSQVAKPAVMIQQPIGRPTGV